MRLPLTTLGHLAIIVAHAVVIGIAFGRGFDRPYSMVIVILCSAVALLFVALTVYDAHAAERKAKESRDGEKQMAALAIKAMTERDALRSQVREFERVTGMKYDDLPEDVI